MCGQIALVEGERDKKFFSIVLREYKNPDYRTDRFVHNQKQVCANCVTKMFGDRIKVWEREKTPDEQAKETENKEKLKIDISEFK
jgi:hypothetical protein